MNLAKMWEAIRQAEALAIPNLGSLLSVSEPFVGMPEPPLPGEWRKVVTTCSSPVNPTSALCSQNLASSSSHSLPW